MNEFGDTDFQDLDYLLDLAMEMTSFAGRQKLCIHHIQRKISRAVSDESVASLP
jgi:hypothetical protein